MPPVNGYQVRLLRVLQDGELERVGAQRSLSVDVRIVVATNFGLARAVKEGTFRQDLFYRLNVVNLFIPRLAERSEDIPHLVDLILKRLSLRYKKPVKGLNDSLMQKLLHHDWPGNVRELENMLERAVLFAKDSEIRDLQFATITPSTASKESTKGSCKHLMERTEKAFLEQALSRNLGDVGEVSSEMKVTKRAVYLRLKKLGIDPSDYRPRKT